MSTTSPDGIFYPATTYADGWRQADEDQADTVQAALATREIHTFQWANSAARAAEAGMVEGDIGYQADTDTTYRYTGSAWLYGFHQESTLSVSVGNASETVVGTFTADSGNTTATLYSASAGVMTFANPGVYDITVTMVLPGLASTGRCFINAAFGSEAYRNGFTTGEDKGSLTISGLYVPSTATTLTLTYFQTSGGTRTLTGRVIVTKRA